MNKLVALCAVFAAACSPSAVQIHSTAAETTGHTLSAARHIIQAGFRAEIEAARESGASSDEIREAAQPWIAAARAYDSAVEGLELWIDLVRVAHASGDFEARLPELLDAARNGAQLYQRMALLLRGLGVEAPLLPDFLLSFVEQYDELGDTAPDRGEP